MSTATSLSKNSFCSSSSSALKVEETAMEKQGIVSILGSDYSQGTKPAAASFRRTLSVDMSSKKWLAQNGFKPPMMKKTASSEQLSIISILDSSSSEEEEEFDGKKLGQNRKQDHDVWSSIISQSKTQELPPPYVHPLVKKSSSSLSEKSLEICTESLGSETGSDGFSSSETGSEADDSDKVEELSQSQMEQQQEKEPLQSYLVSEESPAVAKYNYSAASCKKSIQHRSFPPPLPSLTRSSKGPSLHMHSHREHGRLVLEAVSVPSTKNFHAQRQDGRLRLTLLNTAPSEQHQVQLLKNDETVILDQKGDKVEEDLEEVSDIFEKEEVENEIKEDEEEEEEMDEYDEEKDEEIEKDVNEFGEMGIVMEQAAPKMARGMINVHRSIFILKKPEGLENQKPTWTQKFNYTPAKLMQVDAAEEDEETTQLPQSLPPRPRVAQLIPGRPPAAAASLNAYEYFWRTKPVAASQKNPLTHNCLPLKNNTINKVIASNKPKAYEQQQLVVLRNCKEARRSLLSWGPYCIATT